MFSLSEVNDVSFENSPKFREVSELADFVYTWHLTNSASP